MSAEIHSKAIRICLALYIFATWTTMAGMEIFGWLTFLLTMSYAFRNPPDEVVKFRDLARYLPWQSCLLLIVITIAGVFINGTVPEERLDAIGSQRWPFLFFSTSFGLALWAPTLRAYRVFLFVITIVGLYAIFQSLTGMDLLRPGSHRAVQALDLEASTRLWRSAGLWGGPLYYGYIAGLHVCLPLAMALLIYPIRKTQPRLFWFSVLAYVIVSLSIVTTFTRGAWIAMAVAHLFVALLVSRKLALSLARAGVAALGVMFATVEQFRVRFLSLFDTDYAANHERWFLWRANWEMFKDFPILGIGYQQNETRAREYVTRLGEPDAFTGHAHNNYIQMLSGTGITGFATYMFLISYMLWLNWRLWKQLPADLIWPRAIALAALGAQIHLHIGGFTECNFKAGSTNHNFMVVWALVVSMSLLQAKGLIGARFRNELVIR